MQHPTHSGFFLSAFFKILNRICRQMLEMPLKVEGLFSFEKNQFAAIPWRCRQLCTNVVNMLKKGFMAIQEYGTLRHREEGAMVAGDISRLKIARLLF